MTPKNYQLHTTTSAGDVQISQVLQAASLSQAQAPAVTDPKTLLIPSQPGFQYKLIDVEAGSHVKGQKLLRLKKNLQVLVGETVALEFQDYFVASITPLPNAPVYKLENQSCEEVQVTANLPKETFEISKSLIWTEQDDALDCKVALLNPSNVMAFLPAAPVAIGIGLGELSGAALGLIAMGGGSQDTPVTPPPPLKPTAITIMTLTSATGEMNHRLNATDTLTATVLFDGVVILNTASGSPTLTLLIGSQSIQATYVSGSGTQTLVFVTTIVNEQTDLDGVAIASNALQLNGATLKDTLGNATVNTASTVLSNPNFLVDTTPPIATLQANSLTLTQALTASVVIQSNELGKAYLVPSTSTIATLSDLESLSPVIGRSVAIESVQTNTFLSLSGLPVASYQIYSVDLAGNVSRISSDSLVVTESPNPPPPPPPPPPPLPTYQPKVSIASNTASLRRGQTAEITFTFSDDPGISFSWNGSVGDIGLLNGSLSAISGTGLVRKAVFTPTANLASGNASITITAASYIDASNNLGNAGTSPFIRIDTVAPTAILTGGQVSLSDSNNLQVAVASSELGRAFLVTTQTIVNSLVDLEALNGTLAHSVNILAPNSNTLISLNGLPVADYKLYTVDLAGNVSLASNATYSVTDDPTPPPPPPPPPPGDTTSPTVSITSNLAALKVGETANITFTFSEDPSSSFVWDGTTGDLVVTGGTLGAISGTGLTRTAVFTPTANLASGNASITVTNLSYSDFAGNAGSAGVTPVISIDTLAPLISSVALTSSNGAIASASDSTVHNLNATDTLTATVTFDDVLTVNTASGSPTLALIIGGSTVQANYVSGSGTNALVFTTAVAALQNDTNGVAIALNALSLNNASIKDVNGNNATITSAAVADNAKYLVDTTRPTVAVTSDTANLISAQTATITFTFSEDPGSSFVWNGTTGDLVVSGGSLGALSTTGNPLTRTAILTPATGVSGGTANVTVSLNSYADAAGNVGQEAVAGVADKSTNITVNTTTTALSSVVITSADNIQNNLLNAGDVVYVTATYSDLVNLNVGAGTPSLKLNIGGTEVNALYASGSGTNALVFAYTVLAAQTDINGIAIVASSVGSPTFNLNGRTLTDTAGNTTVNTYSAVADNANFLVDTTAPTLVSMASSRSTFLSGQTSTITFTFSEDPGTTFAWNGTAGDVTLVEGTLTAISGIGLTRTATFYPTQGLTGGNASLTVNNNLYTDLAGNLGTGNVLTGLVINTSPATLMTMQLTSAVGLQNSTLNAGDTVNVTAHFSEAQTVDLTGGSPTLELQIDSTAVVTTYVSGAGTADLFFSYTVLAGQTDTNGIAINANALQLSGSTLIDPRGNTTLLPASVLSADNAGYKVDTTAPILKTMVFDKSSLKASETATVTFTFSEDVSSTFTWNGTAGDLSVTGGTLSAISSLVLSGSDYVATATFTPTASSTATGIVSTALAAYSDAAGNAGNVGTSASIAIDTAAPSLTTMNISGASGILSNTLNAGDVVEVTATFNEAVVINATGNKPQVQLNIGGTLVYAAYASGSGTTDLLFNYTILAGQNDVDGISYSANALGLNTGTLLDAAGNTAVITADLRADNLNYKVDTSAPTVTITSDKSTLLAGQTAAITFTFNEDPGASFAWNGTAGDLSLVNGTLSSVLGAGLTRTATFTPTSGLSGSNASMTVTNNSYNDYAGNLGSGDLYTFTLNTSSPSISSVAFANSVNRNNNFLGLTSVQYFTVNFSESVSLDLTFGSPTLDIVIGTTTFQAIYDSKPAGNQLKFKSIIQAGQNDSNGISLPSNGLQLNGSTIINATGNSATLTYSGLADNISYKVDTIAPTLAFTGTSESVIKANETRTIYFVFSEITNSFDASDVSVDTGTLTWVGGSNSNYSATYIAPSNISSGTVTFSIAAGRFLDYANNPSLLDFTKTLSFDTLAPTLTISVSDRYLATGETAIVTVTSSERLKTGFSLRNLTYPGGATTGTFSAFTENDVTGVYTATFTPSGTATLGYTIAFAAGIFQDTAGNLGLATSGGAIQSNRNTPYIDSIEFFSSTGKLSNFLNQGDTVTMRVYFSQVGFLNTASGSPTLKLMIGTEQVLATYLSGGESPNGTTQLLFKYTILSGQTDTDGISIPINALALNGSTLKSIYGPDFTITIAAVTSDSTYKVDTTPPSLSITSDRSVLNTGQTATITFTFSEDPGSTFAWDGTTGDIVLVGGILGAISGSGLTRTATFTPTPDTASSPGSISVAAGTYTDTAGNAGGAGATPSLTIVTFKDKVYLTDIAASAGGYAINSTGTDAYFGHAVSLVGDFNGDGYGDVVMGAPLNTFTGSSLTQSGAALIHYGGLSTTLVQPGYSGSGVIKGMYLYANTSNAWAGFSVAGVGDINNDGLADVLVGMPKNPTETSAGQAILVYGKSNLNTSLLADYQKEIVALAGTTAALRITSSEISTGFSVSSAGDVNGDGWIDMIVSAHLTDVGTAPNLLLAGKSFVIFGRAEYSTSGVNRIQTISTDNVGVSVPGFVISGRQAGEESGTSVSSAGDFNGDGKADLLVSAYKDYASFANQGLTYVVLGKSTNNTDIDLKSFANSTLDTRGFYIKGESGSDFSGVSVSSGGDINGDGYGDILVGAIVSSTSNPNVNSGKTYVVFGKADVSTNILLSDIANGIGGFAIVSTAAGEQSGHSVSSAGDVNGDGLMDIIIGGPGNGVNGSNTGQSYVVYGKATLTNVSLSDVANNTGGFAIVGEGSQDLSGYSVGAAGDVNGDGLADLMVGAPGYDAAHGTVQTGRSYIILGATTGPFKAGSFVDDVGTSGNDTLTSTGSQTLAGGSMSAGTGNDTFISNGADILLGGGGKDTFVLNQSTITALQNVFGAGGNTTQLARIDGGGGIDTLRLGGTGALDLNLSSVKNISVGNIEGMSRINSIEYIDLKTDVYSNQLTIRVDDVLDMAGSNWINDTLSGINGEGGWRNAGSSTTMSSSTWQYHQFVIDGTSQDTVSTAGWTLLTTGMLNGWQTRDNLFHSYNVYTATDGRPAMMMVEQDIKVSTIL